MHDDISPGTLDQRLLSAEMSNRAALQAARGKMLTASARVQSGGGMVRWDLEIGGFDPSPRLMTAYGLN